MQSENKNLLKNESGQSLLEFMLLFIVIVSLSIGVVRLVNGNLADYWLAMAQLILQDPQQQLTLR